jgi:hypothetical protein
MSYFVDTQECTSPLARPLVGASVFQAGRPRLTDEDLTTRDSVILTAYGSTKEAALLSLRAALQAAVGAVEMEVRTLRENRVDVVDAIRAWADAEDDEEEDTNPGIQVITAAELLGQDDDDGD